MFPQLLASHTGGTLYPALCKRGTKGGVRNPKYKITPEGLVVGPLWQVCATLAHRSLAVCPRGYIPCLHVPTAETPAGLYLKLENRRSHAESYQVLYSNVRTPLLTRHINIAGILDPETRVYPSLI